MTPEELDEVIERHRDQRERTGAECFGPEDVAAITGDPEPARAELPERVIRITDKTGIVHVDERCPHVFTSGDGWDWVPSGELSDDDQLCRRCANGRVRRSKGGDG